MAEIQQMYTRWTNRQTELETELSLLEALLRRPKNVSMYIVLLECFFNDSVKYYFLTLQNICSGAAYCKYADMLCLVSQNNFYHN